ncbi:flavin-containing monooxygenase [Aspergillus puulaauensis]|uniref:FAD/NAD(P)-binding domain-containing protein n=1 Tax=Aspergillus puulaauensis TaxID=1220207 RepID=A0A7R8AV39_9EURO|nr:uncharacterized protein APUU_80806S [Aspergillus puulaauensis]BCS30503.1 hypothetical protein APUU_80806S [Aspergillus puulaauensis]
MTIDIKEVDAVVVGGGFAGVRLAHLFKNRLNLPNVVGIDRGSDIGGTWFWNQYPGAQSDSESWVYTFSDNGEPKWTNRYLNSKQVQAQIKDTAQRTGIYDSFIFENDVVSAHYDAERNRWEIATDKGLRFSATYFVGALGILSRPNLPKYAIADADVFQGLAFHSSRWPRDLDVTGKRVAVIGTGPSGSQIAATVHPKAKQLTVFQQRAQYITPVNDRPIPDDEKAKIQENHKSLWETVFGSLYAMGYNESQKSALEATPEQRKEVYETLWNKGGGFSFFFESFADLGTNFEANETAAAFIRGKIAEIVKDPKTAKLLQPEGAYGGRPLCAHAYYEAFNEPNVALVDIASNPVAKLTKTGLQLQDGQELEFDVIVYATGYDAVDGAYGTIDITGREGRKLTDAWKDGPNALYGLSVADFPNLFTVSGPGGPFSNIPPAIEVQGDFVAELVEESVKRGGTIVEAQPKPQEQWDETVQAVSKQTVFDSVKSWIQSNNVAGKKKYSAFFLGGLSNYKAKLVEEADAKYPSFVFGSA